MRADEMRFDSGSIPLLWTQQPALKYKARIVIEKDQARAVRDHRSPRCYCCC
jgi:hypothetical protein